MELYEHQREALAKTKGMDHVAYYYDMGLGKTYIGSEKMKELGSSVNLIVCQKSKLQDWCDHCEKYYGDYYHVFTLTSASAMDVFFWELNAGTPCIGIINYDLVWRRKELLKLQNFTLVLDESSLIQNETTKRSSFILKMNPVNVILLSGTPTGGKYELLWSQMHLLGWNISKELYWKQYVDIEYVDCPGSPTGVRADVVGYKNVDRLKRKMREHGCLFKKTEEVIDLPEQTFQKIYVPISSEYKKFRKDKVLVIDGKELVGDNVLTERLYCRELCGQYNKGKLDAFRDLVESTNDRLVVFYNFTDEYEQMSKLTDEIGRPKSTINGTVKDLESYEKYDDSITYVQYQSGAMGLNLQKANKVIYYSPTESSMLYEQSKKRIHRMGQNKPCFYYQLVCKSSIEEWIYMALAEYKDYTDDLFIQDSQYYVK